ncbi:hypothetical protein EV652_107168 [Kribbella steppae]|uniref:Uncharacterized protein n=1 Tax=Kribbella steppae TaxID=2512223 RepID=A0A4R2HE08_9ACTN|nr:hypothetical protein [Kribbella steppae]TCO26277.1 hypothetical protein EV652_107168 [Kribbella steppae]
MDCDDSGEAPDLDEITLLRLPPPDTAQRIPDDRAQHLPTPDDPEQEEEDPWWRRDTGG